MTPIANPDLDILQQAGPLPQPAPEDNTQEDPAQKAIADADKQQEDDEIDKLLLTVFKTAEEEDRDNRYGMLARAKRNELYFNNIQNICYDEVARDYRSLPDAIRQIEDLANSDDIKINNIYRAFAESLVAALSISVPATEFIPDDAEDPDDVDTAEAYSKISELISRHNCSQLMLVKALTIFFNQGIVFGFNYANSSADYGTYQEQTGVNKSTIFTFNLHCAECAEILDSNLTQEQVTELQGKPMQCNNCDANLPPETFQVNQTVEEPTISEHPKTRSLYDIFGCTTVKVSMYAKKQSDLGYLILRVDDNAARFKNTYREFADKIVPSSGDNEAYERWARMPYVYGGTVPEHLTTARYGWIRPWYFWTLNNPESAQQLLAKYPNGVMIAVIGDTIVDKTHEKLDDFWTVTIDPRANFIHGEPAGNALIPMQDVENDVFNLGIQSIAYGIPETFANPKSVNFAAYKKSSASPGMLTKAIPPGPNQGIGDAFHTLKAATLSGEYTSFAQSISQKTQFTTGAIPSIFGGQLGDKGSPTATEYTESRSRALQRLQLTWQILSIFWGQLTFKACKLYANNLQEDEQFSKKQKGTFINVTISKASLNGNTGHVEPEVNGQLPQSWAQKKDFFMSLIQLGTPEVAQIVMHPNNSQIVKFITGMPDIYIPGEHDVDKQAAEYYELCQGQPLSPTESSVPIDVDVDEHPIHISYLKDKLVSPEGVQLYKTTPAAYQNCILHLKQHEMAIQQKQQGAAQPPNNQQQQQQGGQPPQNNQNPQVQQ